MVTRYNSTKCAVKKPIYQRIRMPYYYMLRYARTVHVSIVRRLSELVDSRPSFQFPNQCEAVCELCMLGNISDHSFVIVRSCCVTEKNCWSHRPKLSTFKLRLSGNSSWATSGNKLRRHQQSDCAFQHSHFFCFCQQELRITERPCFVEAEHLADVLYATINYDWGPHTYYILTLSSITTTTHHTQKSFNCCSSIDSWQLYVWLLCLTTLVNYSYNSA